MSEFNEIDLGIKSGIGSEIIYFDSIDSTNTFLKDNIGYYSKGTVIWAGTQTAGRGRDGHKWDSPESSGLYFSILLKPEIAIAEVQLVTLLSAVAVKRSVEELADRMMRLPKPIDIKWPNDLFSGGKKFAGILVEAVHSAGCTDIIIGIGVNLSMESVDFIPEIRSAACSLKQIYGGNWVEHRNDFLEKILLNINQDYQNFDPAKIVEEYRASSNIWGKACMVDIGGRKLFGVCKDITERGELIIDTDTGEQNVIAGSLFVEW